MGSIIHLFNYWVVVAMHYDLSAPTSQLVLIVWLLGKQQLLAVGDSMGTLHVMEVPWNLRHPSANEVNCTTVIFFLIHLVEFTAGN